MTAVLPNFLAIQDLRRSIGATFAGGINARRSQSVLGPVAQMDRAEVS